MIKQRLLRFKDGNRLWWAKLSSVIIVVNTLCDLFRWVQVMQREFRRKLPHRTRCPSHEFLLEVPVPKQKDEDNTLKV
jgi:hypothetical protein